MEKHNYEFIKTESQGHVFTVTINRPEVMNALHPPAQQEMAVAWDFFAETEDLWVGIVTGAGPRAFSAGNDLKYTAEHKGSLSFPSSGFGGLTNRFDLTKPIIAAVGGVALGGGFEIALASDIIVASENASFGLPEPRVGLAALAGGMHRLPRQIGLKNAMALMLTGRHIDAAEAMRLGLVQEVCAPDQLMERALAWAEEICQCAPLSIRASKESAMGGLGHTLKEAMGLNFDSLGRLFSSEDFVEGPRAFAEKRKPQWKGR
ncbi:MAG: enoyl-CoA hydratase-related protein [Deltaproteobacteria bacterium]